jgi:hypothetical protein
MARSLKDARPAASGISRPTAGISPGACTDPLAVCDHHAGSCKKLTKSFNIPVITSEHENEETNG